MKFKFVLLVLACLAVVQAKLVKKCGTPIYALCAIGNSPQACGISPFCPSRGLKLRNNILGCCCSSNPTTTTRRGSLGSSTTRSRTTSNAICSGENMNSNDAQQELEINLEIAAEVGKLLGVAAGTGFGLGSQGRQVGLGAGANVAQAMNSGIINGISSPVIVPAAKVITTAAPVSTVKAQTVKSGNNDQGLNINLGVAADVGKLLGVGVGAGVGLGSQGLQVGLGAGANVANSKVLNSGVMAGISPPRLGNLLGRVLT